MFVTNGAPNRAAERLRENIRIWDRPDWLDSEVIDRLADGFVREDRRRLVGVPGLTDASTFIEQQRLWSDLGHGPHSIEINEIIGTRGDRCVSVRLMVAFEDGFSIGLLLTNQFDEEVNRLERLVVFDVDDVEEALRELDHLSGHLK